MSESKRPDVVAMFTTGNPRDKKKKQELLGPNGKGHAKVELGSREMKRENEEMDRD